MAFNFRFEKILELKRKEEDSLKSELALLNLKKVELLEEKERLSWELTSLKIEFLERQGKGLCSGELRLYLQFIDSLSLLIDRKDREIAELEEKIKMKREEIIEASKERKKFEKLKERAFESYLEEELYKERVFLDEVGQNLSLRRERLGP